MTKSVMLAGAVLASSAVVAQAQPLNPTFVGGGGAVYARFFGSAADDASNLFYKIGGGIGTGTLAGYTQIFLNNGVGSNTAGNEVFIGNVASGTEVFFALQNTSTGGTLLFSGTGATAINPNGQAYTRTNLTPSNTLVGTQAPVNKSNPLVVPGPIPAGLRYTTAFDYEDRTFPPNTLLDYNDLRFEVAGVNTTAPEPSTVLLMGAGMLAVGVTARRRRKV